MDALEDELRTVLCTVLKLAPQGLRVFVSSKEQVANSLARQLIAATYISSHSYLIFISLNLAGDALVYLTRSFDPNRPSVETLRAAIQNAINDGELVATKSDEVGVNQTGEIAFGYWTTLGQ